MLPYVWSTLVKKRKHTEQSQRLAKLLQRQTPKATGLSMPETLINPCSAMDCLIILDRRVDMITPLLTQLTYEGLVDEVFGIKNCTAPSYPLQFMPSTPHLQLT